MYFSLSQNSILATQLRKELYTPWLYQSCSLVFELLKRIRAQDLIKTWAVEIPRCPGGEGRAVKPVLNVINVRRELQKLHKRPT